MLHCTNYNDQERRQGTKTEKSVPISHTEQLRFRWPSLKFFPTLGIYFGHHSPSIIPSTFHFDSKQNAHQPVQFAHTCSYNSHPCLLDLQSLQTGLVHPVHHAHVRHRIEQLASLGVPARRGGRGRGAHFTL